jgi:hypothetical protein
MMAIAQQRSRPLAGLTLGLMSIPTMATQTVVEFFAPDLNDCAISADPAEHAIVRT